MIPAVALSRSPPSQTESTRPFGMPHTDVNRLPRHVGPLRRMRAASIAVSAAVVVLVGLGLIATPRAQTPSYDVLIRNGRIVDGTGSPWYRGDVAIRGDTIVRIAPRIEAPAARVIDAAGASRRARVHRSRTRTRGAAFSKCRPLRTTCGRASRRSSKGRTASSPLPIKPFLDRVARRSQCRRTSALFVGQGSIRGEVIGPVEPQGHAEAEIEKMRGLVRAGHGGRRVRPEHRACSTCRARSRRPWR